MGNQALTEKQIQLIQDSFAALAPRGEELVTKFYDKLFTDYPAVKPMFTSDPAEQRTKLLASLKLVVENLRSPEKLAPALAQLGERHLEYGAEPPHYEAVASTMLSVMADVAGELWNEELEATWGAALTVVSKAMIKSAEQLAVAQG